MRVDAALEAEQKSDAYDPVATLHWHDGANWIDLNPSDQLREGIRIDAPYSTQAQIKLDNSDGTYDALDVKGKLIRMGFGSGTHISYLPYLWGEGRGNGLSQDGITKYLYGQGAWEKLAGFICKKNYDTFAGDGVHNNDIYQMTIKQMINWVCQQAGLGVFSLGGSGGLAADISTDGYIENWKPSYIFYAGQTGFQIVKALLELTQCLLVPFEDTFKIKVINGEEAACCSYSDIGTLVHSGSASGRVAGQLYASGENFTSADVGRTANNVTDSTSAIVTACLDSTHLQLSADIFAGTEAYQVLANDGNLFFESAQPEDHSWKPMKVQVLGPIVFIHLVQDTTNIVTGPVATDKATFATLAREIKADYNNHRLNVGGVYHPVADTVNAMFMDLPHLVEDLADTITQEDAGTGDYEACCDLLIAIRAAHNLHCDGLYTLDYHNVADAVSLITTHLVHESPAKDDVHEIYNVIVDIASAIDAISEAQWAYEGHLSFAGHLAEDTINGLSAPNAVDNLTASIAANEIKAKFNAHRTQSGVHHINDATNIITAADALDSLIGVLWYSGASYVDYTAQAKSPAVSDFKLLVPIILGGGIPMFCFSDRTTTLHLNIGQAATGDGTVTWKYWNGSSWVTCTGVTDNTNGFKTAGVDKTVVFDDPGDGVWVSSTIDGITGFWIEADIVEMLYLQGALGTNAQGTIDESSIIALASDIKAKFNAHRNWWEAAIATFANAAHNCYEYHRELGPSPAAHVVTDEVNVGGSSVATEIATAILRANDIKAKENGHFLHPVVSIVAMANHEKAQLNYHFIQATVHVINDTVDTVVADNATDLTSACALVYAVAVAYNAHLSAQNQNSGEYTDPGWLAAMGYYVWRDIFGLTTSSAICVALAKAMVLRAKLESDKGSIVTQGINALQELFDVVSIEGDVPGVYATERIGVIRWYWQPEDGSYYMVIGLGGVSYTLQTNSNYMQSDLELLKQQISESTTQTVPPAPTIIPIIDQDIGNGANASVDYSVERGYSFSVIVSFANTTDGNDGFTVEAVAYDSAGNVVGGTKDKKCPGGEVQRSFTFYSGNTSGTSTPLVRVTISNSTGGSKHFHAMITPIKLP